MSQVKVMFMVIAISNSIWDYTGNVKEHPARESYVEIAKSIQKHSYDKVLDPAMVLAIMAVESDFKQNSESPTKRVGLMQVTPKYVEASYEKHQMYDIDINIDIGTNFMVRWKKYHETKCTGDEHHWVQHYNNGTKTNSNGYSEKVLEKFEYFKKKLKEHG